MKTSLKWLSEYVDLPDDSREIAERLTLAGLEVESVEDIGRVPQGVVSASILEREAHPNADRLSVCKVDAGKGETLTIVCGAPNCLPGKKVPLATVGTVFPGDFRIRKAKLRGVNSEGMLCSGRELGLNDDQSGLMELPADSPVGVPLAELIDSDTVIDWEVTPNRPDWLSHIGIAREAAAVFDRTETLRLPDTTLPAATEAPVAEVADVRVKNADLCPRYTARVIRNVHVAPSPEWMQRHLRSVGIRPINNVVDITNFVLMEYGQPLHAFDYDVLSQGTVVVRPAREGEQITTLDGRQHTLSPKNLVIADPEKPVALAGVMGAANSEISEATQTVLLESAAFKPSSIRATARQFGLSTDSSHRFERGVSMTFVDEASRRAASLICELAGGELLDGVIDAYPAPYTPYELTCRYEKVNALLGTDIDARTVDECFERLQIPVQKHDEAQLTVSVPDFRLDLEREADLIEEVARLFGLDNIPEAPVSAKLGGPMSTDAYYALQNVRDELLALGLTEAVNYSLQSESTVTRCTEIEPHQVVTLSNPISAEAACMRATLVPDLVQTAARNIAHGNDDLALFELGRVIVNDPDLPEERHQAGIVLTGRPHPERYGAERHREYDFFDLKGILQGWMRARRITAAAWTPSSHPALENGCCAEISVNGESLGFAGRVTQELAGDMRLKHPLFVAVVELERLFALEIPPATYQSLPQFPGTVRDISLVAPVALANSDVLACIEECSCPTLRCIALTDLYQDKALASEDKHSRTYSLTYRADERTLTDEEVNEAHDRIRRRLAANLPVELR